MATCKYLGCNDDKHAHGLCNRHYLMARKGNLGDPSTLFGVFGRTSCEHCDREPMGGGYWCEDHFIAYVRTQDVKRPRRRGNPAGTDYDPGRTAVHQARLPRWVA